MLSVPPPQPRGQSIGKLRFPHLRSGQGQRLASAETRWNLPPVSNRNPVSARAQAP